MASGHVMGHRLRESNESVGHFCGPLPNENHLFHCGWIQARKDTCCDLVVSCTALMLAASVAQLQADPEYLKPGPQPSEIVQSPMILQMASIAHETY